jgi:peptide/nickel transport system permease protein
VSRWQYLLKRLALAVPTLLFGTSIVFMLIRLGPISPAAAIVGMGNPQAFQRVQRQLGLNQPLWEQYFRFMADLLTFSLGQSWVIQPNTNVIHLITIYAPRTIWLGFWAVLLALLAGIPLGFYAGLNPNTLNDYFASAGGILSRSMPNFWISLILILLLSQSEKFLFGFSWDTWLVSTKILTPPPLDFFSHPLGAITNPGQWWTSFLVALKVVIPPALVLGTASMGNEMRIGRTAVLETINSNYVETAKAKGLRSRTIIWKHVFRNAMIPLIPIITGELFLLLGGAVIVEAVFAYNGIGLLFYQAAKSADLPLLGSLMFFFILIVVLSNLLQDLLYTLIDPRVGYDQN